MWNAKLGLAPDLMSLLSLSGIQYPMSATQSKPNFAFHILDESYEEAFQFIVNRIACSLSAPGSATIRRGVEARAWHAVHVAHSLFVRTPRSRVG